MNFNRHFNQVGQHAFLSASNYHWVRYSDEKLESVFLNAQAAAKGDRLHKLAHDLIQEGIKLPATKKTLNLYVNDAIGFKMTPEQVLYYSDNAFGTADSISFRRGMLRIHDLKTGVSPASLDQLKVYVAFFCLEYGFKPMEIQTELRIYKNDEVSIYAADPDEITHIMDRIVTFDQIINRIRSES